MTPEQVALVKGATLDRDRTTRDEALRAVDRAERDAAALHQVTQLRNLNQDCQSMTAEQYRAFKAKMGRALRGLPAR
jgi:hypothetical protein